ncbi:topoisomerase II-associated protein PAT1-domain-containing protein [Halteromyces radiatus]|uniref:topoisomerase II-associated protein PAT1-domain-containing protein n=1 Tax=Halteromyces radiatus TaxID=101107 RepID=UPI0022203883|nr:topoisomerase II-associated protein PAT1-domain-containing protein [Halteromyces radiatus]KAI8092996.1 topoisomerase II-associated protein PAT1-domain-containing protein [Halteromyces radiatus]
MTHRMKNNMIQTTTNTTVTGQLLHDTEDIEVYEFSSLRDELADDNDFQDDESDFPVTFEHTGKALDIAFSTSAEKVSSSTFEEEAFAVRKPTQLQSKLGTGTKQQQSNILKKNPFATQYLDPKTSKSTIASHSKNKEHAPSSGRQVSSGISFVSALSGKIPETQDKNDDNTSNKDIQDNTIIGTTSTIPSTTSTKINEINSTNQPHTTTTLQELEANIRQRSDITTGQSHPVVYNLSDIEGRKDQMQSSNRNLLHQLLPGLSQQPQSTPPPPVNQKPFDIESFFQNHQANVPPHQRNPIVQKPNQTVEQEIEQKEEDDAKNGYNGLMNAKDLRFIDQIQQSQLLAANQQPSSDFYYQMYMTPNGNQPHMPPVVNGHYPIMMMNNNNDPEQQTQSPTEIRANLDKILEDVKYDREHMDGDSTTTTTSTTATADQDKEQSNNATDEHESIQEKKTYLKKDHHHLLKTIESIYFLVLQVEQSYRERDGNATGVPGNTQNATSSPSSSTRQDTIQKIWDTLTTKQKIPTIISILSVNKGMSLIGRILPHLNDHQRHILMTTIAYHFVDIIPPLNSTNPRISQYQQQQRQNIDYIHPSVTACLENSLYWCSLSYISQILSVASNHPDFQSLIGTKTGQRFLGSLLFHAKGKQQQQQQQSPPLSEKDIEQWQKVYQDYFTKTIKASAILKETIRLENMEGWLLLNAMIGCCDQQQKEKMIFEFREIVSTTVKTISDLTSNFVPVPYHIQAVFPIVNDLWTAMEDATDL